MMMVIPLFSRSAPSALFFASTPAFLFKIKSLTPVLPYPDTTGPSRGGPSVLPLYQTNLSPDPNTKVKVLQAGVSGGTGSSILGSSGIAKFID
ncbi:hypothetical protein D3C72_1396850 [compost metagenome]